jgi:Ti-type conjugative transfer relaxase TraA
MCPRPEGVEIVAIGFREDRIISAGRGQSLVGLQLYICRQNGKNPVDGQQYFFAQDAADLVSMEVLLPPGAPLAFADPTAFCAALEEREVTIDRKTRLPRFKVRGQFGKHIILALPKECSAEEHRRLAYDWTSSTYVQHGVGAVVAVHRPDDPLTGNAHAHIILSTRVITKDGVGRKARHLNPRFTRGAGQARATLHPESAPAQWAAFQDAWFIENGIELRTDPFQRKGGVHLGRARYLAESNAEAANLAAFEESKRLVQDPCVALEELTRRKAMFSRRDIFGLFRRYSFSKEEVSRLTDLVLNCTDLVPLHDPETGAFMKLYTSRAVRAQEAAIMAAATHLIGSFPTESQRRKIAAKVKKLCVGMGLSSEQVAALQHLSKGPNLRILRGIAGAGKSYTIQAVRQALEAAGYRVIGLAPTNTVACAMAADKFSEASTVDLELLRQENPRAGVEPWDAETCLIIDEAGMIDAGRYERLLVRAAAAGARVILVGDEKQLASVERGGIFDHLKAQHGCAELREVRRQSKDWAKAASQDFAAGQIREGLQAYETRGHLHWSEGLEDAMTNLCQTWGKDQRREPDANRFVYAATNVVVNKLNQALQNERWRGRCVAHESFETERGTIDLVLGDRIQLHGTDRKLGLFNGIVGTVTARSRTRIYFLADTGQHLSFDPQAFKNWALGYAGTTYRGQGKTQDHVYALYDHQLAWHARTGYVGFTRHKQSMNLFVPRTLAADFESLARQMSRADQSSASTQFLDASEAAALQKQRRKATQAPDKVAQPASKVVGPQIQAKGPRPLRLSIAGRVMDFDIADHSQRMELVGKLSEAPSADLVAACRKLPSQHIGDEGLKDLHIRLASIAKARGKHFKTGQPHPDALAPLRDKEEPLHSNVVLAPPLDEMDFRPMLQEPLDYSIDKARQAKKLFFGFDGDALKALRDAGWHALSQAGTNERLRYPVILAMGFLHSWTWRWRERLGFDVVSSQPPGIYRRQYLSLFDKVRKEFRAYDPATTDEPHLSLSAPLPIMTSPAGQPKPAAASLHAPAAWQELRRQQDETVEQMRKLEARLAELKLKKSAAIGDPRIELTIEIASVTMKLDHLAQEFGGMGTTTRGYTPLLALATGSNSPGYAIHLRSAPPPTGHSSTPIPASVPVPTRKPGMDSDQEGPLLER